MSFYKRYELRRLLADGEAKTFTAVANESGREVLLHMFNPAGKPLLADFKARFLRPDGSVTPPAIEIGEFAGSPYAVTETAEPFLGLRQWLQQQAPGDVLLASSDVTPDVTPPRPVAATGGAEPDEFARMVENRPTPVPRQPPLLADNSGELTQALGTAVVQDAGEFTRLFGPGVSKAAPPPPLVDDPGDFTRAFGPAPPKPAPPRPAPPAASVGPEQRKIDPPPLIADEGDFTRAYGPPPNVPQPARPAPQASASQSAYPVWPPEHPATPPPAPPKPAPSLPPMPERTAEETGEFTKLFGSGMVGQSIDIAEEHAKAARAAPQETRPFQQAGEFTRIFGPESDAGQGMASPHTSTFSLNTSASNLFGRPEDLAVQAGVPAAGSAPLEEDSEYTRKFGGSAKAAEPAQAPLRKASAAAPLPRPGLSTVAIVLITLASAGAIAGLIALVVWLATR